MESINVASSEQNEPLPVKKLKQSMLTEQSNSMEQVHVHHIRRTESCVAEYCAMNIQKKIALLHFN